MKPSLRHGALPLFLGVCIMMACPGTAEKPWKEGQHRDGGQQQVEEKDQGDKDDPSDKDWGSPDPYSAKDTGSPPLVFLDGGGPTPPARTVVECSSQKPCQIEAEKYSAISPGRDKFANHQWKETTEIADYSGSGSLRSEPNDGLTSMENTTGPSVEYAIRFTETGTYYVWVRMNCPSNVDDSIHVGINQKILSSGNMGLVAKTGSDWNWGNRISSTKRVDVKITSTGNATLSLWMREDGVAIDCLMLTTDETLVPSGKCTTN
jgi:hypothetical protein